MKTIIPQKISQWLLPVILLLFILEVLTLPLVLEITYAGRADGPDHILTYTTELLVWDSATGIDEYGVARLDLFDTLYDDTVDGNGDNVVAPGTEAVNILRLKNNAPNEVTFTAVLYCIQSNDDLPVEVSMQGQNLTDTDTYSLPYQVEDTAVLRAVTGSLPADQIQDFDISWLWNFETSAVQDQVDTILGNKDELDTITVGVYIVVEDEGSSDPDDDDIIVNPEPPKTGDDARVSTYLTLMAISLCVLLFLLWERYREKKQNV